MLAEAALAQDTWLPWKQEEVRGDSLLMLSEGTRLW